MADDGWKSGKGANFNRPGRRPAEKKLENSASLD
jgi:hypothetical protein